MPLTDDQARWYAQECSDLQDEQLLKVFNCDVDLSSLPANSQTSDIAAALGHTPRPWTAEEMAALEPTLRAFRDGPLDAKKDILLAISCCVHCNVVKVPSPGAPGSVIVNTPFNVLGNIYGGDFAGLGDAGCPTVRHEIYLAPTTDDEPFTNGFLVASWDEEVLDNAPVNETVTYTAAMDAAFGVPAGIRIFLVSYTCDDFDTNYDYAETVISRA